MTRIYRLFWVLVIFNCSLTRTSSRRNNIIFVLTDDQDSELGGLDPLHKTKELIAKAGAYFVNSFVTTPLCCPSRSSILTGKYASRIFVTNNSISGNCSSLQWQKIIENKTFVKHLHNNGYSTFYAGKYLNQYGVKAAGGVHHIPPGWTEWNGLVGNSVYYDYTLSVNGLAEHHGDHEEDYLTDVITEKSLDFLEEHVKSNKTNPFFMMLSPPACHSPFTPATKYKLNFTGFSAPRTPNFNKHFDDKHWLVRNTKTPMGNESLCVIDKTFVNRWRTLLSVDDMVEKIVKFLEINNLLSNTYVVFSSDNGFHFGQFSLPNDKRQLYEFDIRVPLMVRGPNVRPSQIIKEPILNIDLASTFLDMAGMQDIPFDTDGYSWLPLVSENYLNRSYAPRSAFLVEHEGEVQDIIHSCPHLNHQHVANCYPECVCEDSRNNTYTCIRAQNDAINMMYCSFLDDENFVELYDLNNDPYQLVNLAYQVSKDMLDKIVSYLLILLRSK